MKFWLLICLTGGLISCSGLPKYEPRREFVVNAFWAQDTLAHPNPAFRKINRMTPVIYKNSVIVGNAYDSLISYDLSSLREIWRLPIELGVEASAVTAGDWLFVGSNSGKIYSVDMSSGSVAWSFDTKSEALAQPLLHAGVLYFVTGGQSLYALDAGSGKQLWIHNRQDTSNIMTIRGGSTPAVSDGLIYAGFSDGTLVALNAKTGTEQWEVTLNRNSRFKDIDSGPVIEGEYLYINSYDDQIYCIAKDKGDIIWSAKFGGISTPVLTADMVLATSSRGEIVALNKKDGTEIWKRTSKLGIMTEPLLYEDLVVSGESQGKLLFLKTQTGEEVAAFEPGRGVFSQPVAHRNSLYFISGEGNVYGLKAFYDTKSSIYYLK